MAFVGAEAHIHILKGEGHLQARVLEEAPDVIGMAGERLHLQEEPEHARVDELGQAAEVPAKQPGHGQVIDAAGFAQIVQHALETAGLDGFQARRICCMSEVSCNCESSGKVR